MIYPANKLQFSLALFAALFAHFFLGLPLHIIILVQVSYENIYLHYHEVVRDILYVEEDNMYLQV